ncbi:MAG: TIGR03862 family flavoprotein, partial [Anaerolineales bacterium]
TVHANAVILALGGGSRPEFGSDASWVPLLEGRGVEIAPLKPANCGFDVAWTPFFRDKFEGEPLKSIAITFNDQRTLGEFIITANGVEGSLIYALSAGLREAIDRGDKAIIHLDLTPEWTQEEVARKLARPRGSHSISKHLKNTVNITGVKSALLWEFVPREDFADPERLASAIKALPIPLIAPRPLEEAISTAGGVTFESVDEHLMLRGMPGVFCAGEMLDWEAPTGGYLLTASFASGYTAGNGVLAWLESLG